MLSDRAAPFWLVWNPEGNAPTKRHLTEQSAINEAERLARQCRGKRFTVLRSIETRVVDDMRRIEHVTDIDDELPF